MSQTTKRIFFTAFISIFIFSLFLNTPSIILATDTKIIVTNEEDLQKAINSATDPSNPAKIELNTDGELIVTETIDIGNKYFTLNGKNTTLKASDTHSDNALFRYQANNQDSSTLNIILENITLDLNEKCQALDVNLRNGSATVKVQNSVIKNAANGSAVYMSSDDETLNLYFENVDIFNCETPSLGGAIYINKSNLYMKNVTIYDCVAFKGGAIYIPRTLSDKVNVNMENVTIYDCVAFQVGGAMFTESSNLYMKDVTINDNHADYDSGSGAIYAQYATNIYLSEKCEIYENTCGSESREGDIYLSSNSKLMVNSSDLTGAVKITNVGYEYEQDESLYEKGRIVVESAVPIENVFEYNGLHSGVDLIPCGTNMAVGYNSAKEMDYDMSTTTFKLMRKEAAMAFDTINEVLINDEVISEELYDYDASLSTLTVNTTDLSSGIHSLCVKAEEATVEKYAYGTLLLQNAIDQASIIFDLNSNETEDKVGVTLRKSNSAELENITLDGNTILKKDLDYTIEENEIIFTKSFLKNLSVGKHNIIFVMSDLNDPELELTVIDSGPVHNTINPNNASFDLNQNGIQEDLKVTLIPSGDAELVNIIAADSKDLVEGTHYSKDGNEITFLGSFLKTFPPGKHNITFIMSRPEHPVLILNVTESIDESETGDDNDESSDFPSLPKTGEPDFYWFGI